MVHDGDLVLPEYVVDFEYLTKVNIPKSLTYVQQITSKLHLATDLRAWTGQSTFYDIHDVIRVHIGFSTTYLSSVCDMEEEILWNLTKDIFIYIKD